MKTGPPEQNDPAREGYHSDIFSLGVCFEKLLHNTKMKDAVDPSLKDLLREMKEPDFQKRPRLDHCILRLTEYSKRRNLDIGADLLQCQDLTSYREPPMIENLSVLRNAIRTSFNKTSSLFHLNFLSVPGYSKIEDEKADQIYLADNDQKRVFFDEEQKHNTICKTNPLHRPGTFYIKINIKVKHPPSFYFGTLFF